MCSRSASAPSSIRLTTGQEERKGGADDEMDVKGGPPALPGASAEGADCCGSNRGGMEAVACEAGRCDDGKSCAPDPKPAAVMNDFNAAV